MSTALSPRGSFGLPAILLSVVLGIVGYGIGRFQGNITADDAKQQLEEAQARVKRNEDAVTNVEKRTAIADAYRHALQALLAVDHNQASEAQDHLKQSGQLLVQNGSKEVQPLAQEALQLSNSTDLNQMKSSVVAFTDKFDQLIPKPMNVTGGGQSN